MEFKVSAATVRAARFDGPSSPKPRLPNFTVRSVEGGKCLVGGFARVHASARRQAAIVGGSVQNLTRSVNGKPRFADKDTDLRDADRYLRGILESFASILAIEAARIDAGEGVCERIVNAAQRGVATGKKGGQVGTEVGHDT